LDGSVVERDPWMIRWIPVFMLGLFLLRGCAGFLSQYGMAWVANRGVHDVRAEVVGQYLRLPTAYFDANSSGKITAKLTYSPARY
ncbi:lipid ABC transporter permease/ATP-binding protein, partial [Enterococcus hirae]